MANQEMYKHDAMLHMVWSVAQADETPGNENSVTKQEDSYLDVVRNYEEIKIDWTDFNAKRKHLGYDRERIIDEACKAIRGCGKDWKIKCLGYMQRMAHVSQEDDIENNMSDKEWSLILRAQKELGLSDVERKSSMRDLPSYKKMFTEQEALMHLIWCIAVVDKGANDDKWASSEENAYFNNVAKIEKIDMNYDDFNAKRKKLNSNENQIVREACNSIKSSTKEWKLKCLGYMQRMGWVSNEGGYKDDLEQDISEKEWKLILRAQRELGLTKDERNNSYQSLPRK